MEETPGSGPASYDKAGRDSHGGDVLPSCGGMTKIVLSLSKYKKSWFEDCTRRLPNSFRLFLYTKPTARVATLYRGFAVEAHALTRNEKPVLSPAELV